MVGRVGRAHGLAGDVVVRPETDHPGRFRRGARLLTEDGRGLVVGRVRRLEDLLLVRFEGVDDRSAAETLRGAVLTITATERRPLGSGEFWPDELTGLEVRDVDGTRLGTVAGVEEGVTQDRIVVDTDGGEVAVPFVAALVPEVHLEDGYLVVVPLPGLFS